jgi:hypothetical protein
MIIDLEKTICQIDSASKEVFSLGLPLANSSIEIEEQSTFNSETIIAKCNDEGGTYDSIMTQLKGSWNNFEQTSGLYSTSWKNDQLWHDITLVQKEFEWISLVHQMKQISTVAHEYAHALHEQIRTVGKKEHEIRVSFAKIRAQTKEPLAILRRLLTENEKKVNAVRIYATLGGNVHSYTQLVAMFDANPSYKERIKTRLRMDPYTPKQVEHEQVRRRHVTKTLTTLIDLAPRFDTLARQYHDTSTVTLMQQEGWAVYFSIMILEHLYQGNREAQAKINQMKQYFRTKEDTYGEGYRMMTAQPSIQAAKAMVNIK